MPSHWLLLMDTITDGAIHNRSQVIKQRQSCRAVHTLRTMVKDQDTAHLIPKELAKGNFFSRGNGLFTLGQVVC